MKKFSLIALAASSLTLGGLGCSKPANGGNSGTTGAPQCHVTVTSIVPSFGKTAGGDTVTITGTGFDSTSTASLGTAKLSAVHVTGSTQLTGVTPATTTADMQSVDVTVTTGSGCKGTLANGWQWNNEKGGPKLLSYFPQNGAKASVLATVVAKFDIQVAQVNNTDLTIDSVQGDVLKYHSDGSLCPLGTTDSTCSPCYPNTANGATCTFKPQKALDYGTTYTARVTNGITSQVSGAPLSNPTTWTFTTRKQGELDPWIGDISAASGLTSSAQYKLYSTTGQPTPVGTACDGKGCTGTHTYKLQSGFIHAAQAPSGH